MKESQSNDEKFLINIFDKYQKAKIILEKTPPSKNLTQTIKESNIVYGQKTNNEILVNYQKHVQTVDTVLALLPKTEYTVIVKVFLANTNSEWWKKFYDKNEYQRLYRKAISRFLYLYLI